MTIIKPVFQSSAVSSLKTQISPLKLAAKEFAKVKQDIGALDKKETQSTSDLHLDLVEMQKRVISGEPLKPQELLSYQIKANQFGVRIELISKLAESAMATTRKLQNQQ